MKGLIYKEFALNFRNLLCPLIMTLMYDFTMCYNVFTDASLQNESGAAYEVLVTYIVVTIFTFIIVYLFSYFYFQSDYNKSWQYFSCSAPTGPAGQVGAKYVFVLLTFLGQFVLNIIVALLVVARFDVSFLLLMGLNLLLFSVFLILASIELPFYIRFGASLGKNIKSIVFVLQLFLVFAYFLFGDLSIFEAEEPVRIIMEKISTLFPLLTIFFIILFALPLFCLSMMLSVKLYRKGLEAIEE
ncbi:MAG: ABC-2 transporter permease [Oscillospiraceae bacterium]|nr:ABC-2 transporter permease [Oscillospiraceae bacterium]